MLKITVQFKKGTIKIFDDVSKIKVGSKLISPEYTSENISSALISSSDDILITCPSSIHLISAGTFERFSVDII